MAEYSVYEAKAHLSEVLRLVKTRREVVITERGKPIARIVPFDAEGDDTVARRVERLVASGQIVPAKVPPSEPLPPPRKAPGALQRFLEDRDE